MVKIVNYREKKRRKSTKQWVKRWAHVSVAMRMRGRQSLDVYYIIYKKSLNCLKETIPSQWHSIFASQIEFGPFYF